MLVVVAVVLVLVGIIEVVNGGGVPTPPVSLLFHKAKVLANLNMEKNQFNIIYRKQVALAHPSALSASSMTGVESTTSMIVEPTVDRPKMYVSVAVEATFTIAFWQLSGVKQYVPFQF